jgi:hypothetical protein
VEGWRRGIKSPRIYLVDRLRSRSRTEQRETPMEANELQKALRMKSGRSNDGHPMQDPMEGKISGDLAGGSYGGSAHLCWFKILLDSFQT